MGKTFALGTIFMLVAIIVIAGCQNNISGMVTAIPEVKDKLAVNPGSKYVLTEWPEDFVSRNIDFISQYCTGLEIKPYVLVEIKDEANAVKSAMLIDKDTKKVVCSVDSDLNDFKAKLVESIKKTQPADTTASTTTPFTGKKAKMEFYIMSQCPYGTEVADNIAPVKEKLGYALDLQINYILYPKSSYAGKEAQYCIDDLCSMHGTNEVKGDIVELCAAKYNPDSYLKMIVCMNKNAGSIPGNWEKCAKDSSLNADMIKSCYEGTEGKDLLKASAAKSSSAGASGSPTMFLDGNSYGGARDTLSFQRAVCTAIEGQNDACRDMPVCTADADCPIKAGKISVCESPNTKDSKCLYKDDARVTNIVLNDRTCKTCDTTSIVDTTKQLFPAVDVRYVDISDEQGKQLVKDLGITKVPAYLFGKEVVNTNSWSSNQRLQTAFEIRGDYYKILDDVAGATHFVDPDAKKAYYDSIGVVLGDNKPQIDYFVMAYCPYGNQAEEAIEPAYQLLKGKALFNPHYVIYSTAQYPGSESQYCRGDYCSMHGVQELNQDVREMCVLKIDGLDNYFKFALQMNKDCSAQNADKCWEAVAKKIGIDTQKVKDCEKNDGLSLLKTEMEFDTKLAVSGSPTIFIDGEQANPARTPEGTKQALCAAFDNAPSECNTSLAGADAAAGSAAATQGGCGA